MWREAGHSFVAGVGAGEQQLPLATDYYLVILGEEWLSFRTSEVLKKQLFLAGGDMTSGRVLVYGGRGALGSAIVSKFKVY